MLDLLTYAFIVFILTIVLACVGWGFIVLARELWRERARPGAFSVGRDVK